MSVCPARLRKKGKCNRAVGNFVCNHIFFYFKDSGKYIMKLLWFHLMPRTSRHEQTSRLAFSQKHFSRSQIACLLLSPDCLALLSQIRFNIILYSMTTPLTVTARVRTRRTILFYTRTLGL